MSDPRFAAVLDWLRTRWYLWQLLGVAALLFGFPLFAVRELHRIFRKLFRNT